MWQDKPLHRIILPRSQCSQYTASLAQKTGRTESGATKRQSKGFERKRSSCSPKLKLKQPRVNSGAASDRSKATRTVFPPISEVLWQQPPVPNIFHIDGNLNIEVLKKLPKRPT